MEGGGRRWRRADLCEDKEKDEHLSPWKISFNSLCTKMEGMLHAIFAQSLGPVLWELYQSKVEPSRNLLSYWSDRLLSEGVMQNSFTKSGKAAIKCRKLQFVTLNHLNPAQAVWLTGGKEAQKSHSDSSLAPKMETKFKTKKICLSSISISMRSIHLPCVRRLLFYPGVFFPNSDSLYNNLF